MSGPSEGHEYTFCRQFVRDKKNNAGFDLFFGFVCCCDLLALPVCVVFFLSFALFFNSALWDDRVVGMRKIEWMKSEQIAKHKTSEQKVLVHQKKSAMPINRVFVDVGRAYTRVNVLSSNTAAETCFLYISSLFRFFFLFLATDICVCVRPPAKSEGRGDTPQRVAIHKTPKQLTSGMPTHNILCVLYMYMFGILFWFVCLFVCFHSLEGFRCV